MPPAMDSEQLLSERLLLLKGLGYPPSQKRNTVPSSHRHEDRNGASECDRALCILNTIALLLATGRGDAYAAALDDGILILTKNDTPTQQDVEYASMLLTVVLRPESPDAIYSVILHRCVTNINKRISSVHTSLLAFMNHESFSTVFDDYTKNHAWRIHYEFPGNCGSLYTESSPGSDFKTLFTDALRLVGNISAHGVDTADVSSSIQRMNDLWAACRMLLDTAFLRFLQEEEVLREAVYDLKEQCVRFVQYFDGVGDLIHEGRRFARGATMIPHRWVPDYLVTGNCAEVIVAEDVVDVISRGFEVEKPLAVDATHKLQQRYRGLHGQWMDNRIIRGRYVHAPVRLILYIGPVCSGSSQCRALGLSDYCCLACDAWIRGYNTEFRTNWRTSGCNETPCPSWALPSSAWPSTFASLESRKRVYDRMVDHLKRKLRGGYRWVLPRKNAYIQEVFWTVALAHKVALPLGCSEGTCQEITGDL